MRLFDFRIMNVCHIRLIHQVNIPSHESNFFFRITCQNLKYACDDTVISDFGIKPRECIFHVGFI